MQVFGDGLAGALAVEDIDAQGQGGIFSAGFFDALVGPYLSNKK